MSIFGDNFWNALGAIGENIGALLGGIALIYSISIYRASMMFMHYGELDKTYFDLLNMAVERPYLRTPDELTSEEYRRSYDIYAFMVWNFLETIHDRMKDHSGLTETWMPVLETEAALHRLWFERPDNRPKFKASFFNHIQKTILSKLPPPAAKAAPDSDSEAAADAPPESDAAPHDAPHSSDRPHAKAPHAGMTMPRRRPGRPG